MTMILVFLSFQHVLRPIFLLLQLGKLYLEREEYGKLQKILRQLHQSCQVIVHFKLFSTGIIHLISKPEFCFCTLRQMMERMT